VLPGGPSRVRRDPGSGRRRWHRRGLRWACSGRRSSTGRWDWPVTGRPATDSASPPADYDAWLANLRAAGIDLLFVARTNPADGWLSNAADAPFPIERRWADAHPEIVRPVAVPGPDDPTFRIYRVRFPPGPPVPSGRDASSHPPAG
jgi:hypothetical protein